MSFINKFFKKKSDESKPFGEQILGCGRDMGKFSIDISGGRLFTVGSGVLPVGLTRQHYFAWKMLRSSKSIREWEKKCLEEKIITSAEQLDLIKVKLEKEKLFLDWASIDIGSPILKEYTVTNNGRFIGFSDENQKWIVGSAIQKGKSLAMSSEEYIMWNSATGVMRINDVIHEFSRNSGRSLNDAFRLFKEYSQRYSKAGLWCIEFCGEDHALYATEIRENLTFQEDWFKPDQVSENSQLLACGEEWTSHSANKTNLDRAVIVGVDKIRLEPVEFLIWAACKNGIQSLSSLSAFFNNEPLEEIKEIVRALIQKRVLIVWPEGWKGNEEHLVSIKPTGIGIGSQDGTNCQIVDLTNGTVQKIPLTAYSVWVMGHSCMPLSVIVENFQHLFERPLEEAEVQVARWIPYLIERGLAHLQVIPEKSNR